MQPSQQTPYDFIMASPQKKAGFGGGNSQKTRILQVAVLAGIILIVGLVLVTVLSGAHKSDTTNLYKLAAAQQDIIDMTTMAAPIIRDPQLANQSASAGLVLASQNNDVLADLASLGDKKPAKQIAIYQVKTYAKSLDDAQKNGNYDTAYTALLANRLDDYRVKIQGTYASSSNKKLKAQLSDYYQQLSLLTPTTPSGSN